MGNGVSVNLDENKYVNIYINIASGTVVDNLIFKPQLELNSIQSQHLMNHIKDKHILLLLVGMYRMS